MHVVFADLGKSQDYAVQGIMQHVVEGNDNTRAVDRFVVRYIKRFPLQTSYRDQVAHFKRLMLLPEMRGDVEGVYDSTGVGKAVAEEFERQQVPNTYGISITSGQQVGVNAEGWTVPKLDLISCLLIEAEYGRFVVADGIGHDLAQQLEREMIALKPKINHRTRRVGVEAGTEDVHDDMILSIALGLWWIRRRVYLVENDVVEQKPSEPYNELKYGLEK
jgi:hypothetical protein